MKTVSLCITTFILALLLASCRKSFLGAKPDNALVVPQTIEELQALLDNDMYMNGSFRQSVGGPNPGLLVAGTDDYFIPDVIYTNLPLYSKNVYTWSKEDTYGGQSPIVDWSAPYRAVFYSNIVLEGLDKINKTVATASALDNLKGSALFFRGHTFYQLAQVFAPAYVNTTAPTLPGIPLKLRPDINEKIERATLQQTYNQVLSDVREAVPLLPLEPLYKTRPSKPAAYALLARVYLAMQQYEKAWLYADSCLKLYNSLMDYNTLNPAPNYPLPLFNNEVLFQCLVQSTPSHFYTPSNARVDTLLYNSYQSNDLRKTLFFRLREPGWYSFRGSYDGSSTLFTGIAVDEVYLIRAECYARTGNTADALNDLNTLMVTRWKTGAFLPFTAATAEEALELILTERRKQLLFRGLRWTDLRRLNQDSRFAKTIYRNINGQLLELPPNDNRYTWPIPPEVLGFNPSMPQNPR